MFYDITELLSGTKYVTANLFFPKVCGIYLAISKWQTSNIPKVEEMSALMKEKFLKYWKDTHGLMAIATVLDPRYKLQFLNAMFEQIYGHTWFNEVKKVRDLLYDLVLEYQGSMEGVGKTDGVGTSSNNSSSSTVGSGDKAVVDIFDRYLSSQPIVSTNYVRTELDLYLEEPLWPRTTDLDIIHWWQYAGMKYPTLRNIAQDILAIPVTTVASESVFSTSGRIISPSRSRLAPKMVEALMCMQAWSRAEMLGIYAGFCFTFMVALFSLIHDNTNLLILFDLGPESPVMNALLTCLDDEEEEMVLPLYLF